MYNKKEFEEIAKILNPKNYRSAITTIVSLIEKLNEKEIDDIELKDMFSELLNALIEYSDGDKSKKKKAKCLYGSIVNYAKSEYNLEQKGSIQGAYMAIYMGVGVAIGTALSSANSAFLGIGIALGAGLGVSIGASLEKKAGNEGRLY